MQTRREFMSIAAALAGGGDAMRAILGSVARAAEIEPASGSGFLDAEHVVVLMQENRSFDHTFGTLRGVRGFNDPRAITLPDGNPVWVQTDAAGKRYGPFRYDIKNSKITWMGCLPHGWADQVDARNGGRYDKWLVTKQSGERAYASLPLTLGYFTREDIPFYYALADAFTICDQYFCSSLTGTTPNRCYLWTGTVRERPTADAPAVVRNEEADLDHLVSWPTFPERLEELGVSWKVYQNELTVPTGFNEEEDAWLSNFGDNPLEYFRQYHAHLSPRHRTFVERRLADIPVEIEDLRKRLPTAGRQANAISKSIADLTAALVRYKAEHGRFAGKSLEKLSPRERALHERAFCINDGDEAYRQLADVSYRDGATARTLRVPRGDLLHQFRADVDEGRLPTVSWIVSPREFSDHPSAAWYGAWYIAEVLNILTRRPEVWKKTIFMLTYDENDGYFDHVPPFVAPHPKRVETGRASKGIDTSLDYVELEQDRKRSWGRGSRGGSIGLGYRVPMVIASPWSRGGCVCSQVFDHTSVIQFLEKLLSHKLGRPVVEANISRWRRTVCGDLTSSFQPAAKEGEAAVAFGPRDAFLESIHRAQFEKPPAAISALSQKDIDQIRRDPKASPRLARQEPGVRTSCPLPYELDMDGALDRGRTRFELFFGAGNKVFEERAAGSPLVVFALGTGEGMTVRDYAVEVGERLNDAWDLADFKDKRYHLRAHGPNGFFREFIGDGDDPDAYIYAMLFERKEGRGFASELLVVAHNRDARKEIKVEIRDNAYRAEPQERLVKPGEKGTFTIDTRKSGLWYDFTVRVAGFARFEKRYAGRVETGDWTTSDPAMA